ncbi:phosphoglycolate phosphatase [Paracoccus jiaweipingae]|uniref:phosphoglycolate phosphatase n=1 Tax=unclassified Paracoccus (in: a-proteobacteria) TaxID=2688777 RepID=UPI003799634C
MKPALLFDLDGTLIDSAPDIHASVNAVLRDKGLQPLSFDLIRSFIGGGVPVLWQRVLAHLGIGADQRAAFVAPFMARYETATALTRLYPHVLETLGVLADAGYPLALCTNKPQAPTRHLLDHFGLAALFGSVVCGDTLPQRKPDPAMLMLAQRELGADNALFIGDSEIDAAAAQNADMPLFLFTKGYRRGAIAAMPHQAAFDDFADLPALIDAFSP